MTSTFRDFLQAQAKHSRLHARAAASNSAIFRSTAAKCLASAAGVPDENDAWMNAWMNARMDECMDGCMDVDGWMWSACMWMDVDGWMWMDGSTKLS